MTATSCRRWCVEAACICLLHGWLLAVPAIADGVVDPFAVDDVPGGNIVERRHYEAVDVHRFTLSNGAEVLFKTTDVASTPVLMHSVFPGGLSRVPEATESRVMLAGSAIAASGLRGIRDSALVNLFSLHRTTAQGFRQEQEAVLALRTVPDEIDFAFRALYLMLNRNSPVDAEVLEITRQKVAQNIAASLQQPQFRYMQETNRSLWPGRRFGNMHYNVEELDDVDVDWIEEQSTQLFHNVNGCWFLISGPIDVGTVETYVAKYIGSLEGLDVKRSEANVDQPYAKESSAVRVELNPQDRSAVQMFYVQPNVDRADIKAANIRRLYAMVLQGRLQDKVRVKEGLVYNIGAIAAEPSFPASHGGISIQFVADPDKVGQVEDIVRSEIRATAKKIKKSELTSVRKLYLRSIEQAWKQPGFVVGSTLGRLRQGLPPVALEDILASAEEVSVRDLKTRGRVVANDLVEVVSEFAPEVGDREARGRSENPE